MYDDSAYTLRLHTLSHQVTGTMTDIGSTMGRISMIYLRRACRCSQLTDIERAEIGVDAQKLAVLSGLWTFYLFGGLIGIYSENFVQGPRALLIPAFVTGSMGLTYMACRQLLKDYIKKLEQARGHVRRPSHARELQLLDSVGRLLLLTEVVAAGSLLG